MTNILEADPDIVRHLAHHGFEVNVDPDVHAGMTVVIHSEEDLSVPVASADELRAVLERACPGETCDFER